MVKCETTIWNSTIDATATTVTEYNGWLHECIYLANVTEFATRSHHAHLLVYFESKKQLGDLESKNNQTMI
jgi:hypothetical protein